MNASVPGRRDTPNGGKRPGSRKASAGESFGRTASRVMAMLELIAASGRELGPREVSRTLDVPVSSASRILTWFSGAGIMRRTGDGRYSPGPRLIALAHNVIANSSLAGPARPAMKHLHDHFGDTVLLGELSDDQLSVVFIDAINSRRPLSYRVQLGSPYSLTRGATGLAILAFLSDDARKAAVARAREEEADPLDLRELSTSIEAVRRDLAALTQGERVPGAVGLAAPIFGPDGVVGDICITMPEHRAKEVPIDEFLDELRQAARSITADLGGRWPTDDGQ